MNDDIYSRLGSFDDVWRRVNSGAAAVTAADTAPAPAPSAEYGGFCILPDSRACHTIRFIPDVR